MTRKVKPAHYRGQHHQQSARIRAAANANPDTRCWRCGKTLPEHAPHRNGRPARWQAGHLIDGQPGGPYAPEASTCNASAGAAMGNRKRNPQRTALTW